MCPAQQALGIKLSQVSADGHIRYPEESTKFDHGHGLLSIQYLYYPSPSLFRKHGYLPITPSHILQTLYALIKQKSTKIRSIFTIIEQTEGALSISEAEKTGTQ